MMMMVVVVMMISNTVSLCLSIYFRFFSLLITPKQLNVQAFVSVLHFVAQSTSPSMRLDDSCLR